MAVVHGALVLFMLVGGLLALRWPRIVYAHAPVGLAILGINLAGADCPITWLELTARAHAGMAPYTGGFLGHYVYQPLGLDAHRTSTQVLIYTVALLPNLIGYGLLLGRKVSRGRVQRALPVPAPAPVGEA